MNVSLESLLAALTLEEKINLLAGVDSWHTRAIERLGIPALKVSDGPNGARGSWGTLAPPSACTPVGAALAATWNTDLVKQVGELLADETRAKGSDILLAPTINLHRTPIAGRNFECFSEDPYLSGEMACAYIEGVQSRGVGCCIKHFVCNDQEYQRRSISAEVEERPLRELYLEPFRKAIDRENPWAVMSAYNRVRGEYSSQNDYLLKTILKEEWGFDGLVISDWGGTYSEAVPAGGLDLEMPGPAHWMSAEYVQKALTQGELSEQALDDKIRRLLRTLERAGRFEHPHLPLEGGLNTSAQHDLLRRAAREAIVLLKNDGALPLDGVRRLAVIGANARWGQIWSAVRRGGVPGRGRSSRRSATLKSASAIGCKSSQRRRHNRTVSREVFNSLAISGVFLPSAANNTIRPRKAFRCSVVCRLTSFSNAWRSASVNMISAGFGPGMMFHLSLKDGPSYHIPGLISALVY